VRSDWCNSPASHKNLDMENMNESLEAFQKFLDTVSDEKLDAMIQEIEALGIKGPSVDEYMQGLNDRVSSFYPKDETIRHD
jgi:hypothetical protein